MTRCWCFNCLFVPGGCNVLRDTTSAAQPTCRNLDTITIGTIFEFTLVFVLVGLTDWTLSNDEYRLTISLTGTIARVDGTSQYFTFKLQWLRVDSKSTGVKLDQSFAGKSKLHNCKYICQCLVFDLVQNVGMTLGHEALTCVV